jgi:hypothetical protein
MMDFDFIGGIGWRDIVLVVAAMIGVYLVLSVIRLFKVAGKHHDSAEPESKHSLPGRRSAAAAEAQPSPPAQVPEFADELARSNVEVELERLRRESAHQREELARLAEEISRLKAARNVSPLYNEAMTLAQQGMPATGIAGHCGISIGEAELVAALARSGSEFERHEQGEVRDE